MRCRSHPADDGSYGWHQLHSPLSRAELVEEPRAVEELCSILTEEYQTDAAVIHQDVMSFLERTQGESAIVIS